MIVLLLFAFVSGLFTIAAPCIWPLLPIILSSTATGGHKKPLGVTLGIMISFGVLTLTLSYLVKIIPFDPNALRYIAVGVIGFLGLTLIIPQFSAYLETYVSRLSGKLNNGLPAGGQGFWSGFVTGLSLGIIWTPCAGPILATIATLAATRTVNIGIILVTVVYIIGIGIPLFLFATIGKVLFTKSKLLSKYTGRIQQIFGVIMILTALAIATNYDKVIQTKLLNVFPSYSNAISTFESNTIVQKQLTQLKNQSSTLPQLGQAPDFVGITKWLNVSASSTQVPSIKNLKGKVVLVDFWTYTCINCIRTLPHVTSWYDKYKDKGFVVIGVHTPEFAFEKDTQNVLNAIKQYNIHYPVAQDNDYATWNNYNNQYWPAEYLIDANGVIRRTHFGEGEYDEMEQAIQDLLKEAGNTVSSTLDNMPDTAPRTQLSPETYIGSNRMEFYYPDGHLLPVQKTFTLTTPPANSFSLGGEWNILPEHAVSGKDAILTYTFVANKVFLVLRPPASGSIAQIKVFLDGQPISQAQSGADITQSVLSVDTDRLYHLVDLHGNSGTHVLRLEFLTPGTQVFAFTFG